MSSLMNIQQLYSTLQVAYSASNLNEITSKLILLYKNKNYSKIKDIAKKIAKYTPIEEERDSKYFSKLIMLYHPDKGEQIRLSLKNYFLQNDYESLNEYAHILELKEFENVSVDIIDEDIDYHPEYIWDIDEEQGFYFDYQDEEVISETEFLNYEKTFYNEIKIREYGNVNVDFPSYYLEDFEDFEFSSCGLVSLEGIEHCLHVKILDFSGNNLTDISPLWDLQYLEELYIANNEIGLIDTLINLPNLRYIDISDNYIEDISSLLELKNLEYVNIIGNPVTKKQLESLKKRGVLVMY